MGAVMETIPGRPQPRTRWLKEDTRICVAFTYRAVLLTCLSVFPRELVDDAVLQRVLSSTVTILCSL